MLEWALIIILVVFVISPFLGDLGTVLGEKFQIMIDRVGELG